MQSACKIKLVTKGFVHSIIFLSSFHRYFQSCSVKSTVRRVLNYSQCYYNGKDGILAKLFTDEETRP